MNKKSVVIVGAGIAGMATAITLAKNGFDVTVFEKNAQSGGRCGQILRDGHRFDIGATILLMPSIYRTVFESLGLCFDECFKLKDLSTIYKLYFGNCEQLIFSKDDAVMKPQLEAMEPGSFIRYKAYIETGYKFFRDSYSNLLARNFYNLFEFTTPGNVMMLIRLKTYLKHATFIRRFFKDSNLQQAFTFQNIYVGQSPLKAPALFSMLPATEMIEGALFPIGGMHQIALKLESVAKDAGVKFIYNMTVEKIETDVNLAKQLIFSDGTMIKSDLIVVNADLPYAYCNLLPDNKISARLERKTYSCSAIVFHWGLSKTYPQFEHHSIFLSKDYQKSLNAIFDQYSLSNNPSFYIHAPVLTDSTAAPANEDTISVIVPVGHLDEKNPQDWEELKKIARSEVLKRLVLEGFTDIEDHIKFEICYTPVAWKSIYNVSHGSVFGSIGHNIMQMGYFRPHNRHNRYRNLYFVGGSTHPGNGVPLVLLSAKLTSERIMKEYSQI
jgi:phytoene desaturase